MPLAAHWTRPPNEAMKMHVDATLDRLIMLLVLGLYYRMVVVIFWLLGRGDLKGLIFSSHKYTKLNFDAPKNNN